MKNDATPHRDRQPLSDARLIRMVVLEYTLLMMRLMPNGWLTPIRLLVGTDD